MLGARANIGARATSGAMLGARATLAGVRGLSKDSVGFTELTSRTVGAEGSMRSYQVGTCTCTHIGQGAFAGEATAGRGSSLKLT